MKIPNTQWRRLTIEQRQKVNCLLTSLLICYLIISIPIFVITQTISAFWKSPEVLFGTFGGLLSLLSLLILPQHPMSMPIAMGSGTSVSLILYIFFGRQMERII